MKHQEYRPSIKETAEAQASYAGRRRGLRYYGALATALIGGATLSGEAAANPAQAPSSHETPTYEHQPKTANFEASASETVKNVGVKNRVAYINGKPAFLFGVWAPKDTRSIDYLGVNTLIDNWKNTTPAGLADQAEGRAWVIRHTAPDVVLTEPFPNEIGVDKGADEADGYAVPLQQIIDSPSDGRLNFANYTQHIADFPLTGTKDISINSQVKTTPEAYKAMINTLGPNAIISYDYYYMNVDGKKDGPDIRALYHYTLGVKKMTSPHTPVGSYIETVDLPGLGSIPLTPQIVTGEAKAAIAGGATMINWWERTGEEETNATKPEIAAAIRKFTKDVHRLAPYLLAKPIESVVSDWQDSVKVGGRVMTDKDGNLINVMIIVNTSPKTQTVEKKLVGLDNQPVTDVVDGSKTTARHGKIELTIPAYDWKIEIYKPTQQTTKSAAAVHGAKHTASTTLVRPKKP